ncbi:ATP-dependent nuclease [Aeromonas allosaccharophila]
MALKITDVTINNYKSCIDTKLLLSDFTPLIGYNNAGKSNCLSALQWLLRKSSLSDSDFYDKSKPVEVEATIKGITKALLDSMQDKHKRSIEKYVHNETLNIKRVQLLPFDKAADIKLSVLDPDPASNQWVLNPTGIDNAISALLPEPIRIGAMENAAEDAAKSKTTTTIGKLLAQFLEPVRQAHEQDLNIHLIEVSRRIASDGDMRFGELNNIDTNVNAKVSDLFPGMSIKLHFDTPTIDDLIKAGTLKVFEGQGDGRDFTSYGHGAQRSIQMALVQYLAEVKSNVTGSTTLLLIDEPELYLHPFAIEQVREALTTLSNSGYQVVITTHSAQMVTPELAETALLIRKENQRGTYSRMRLTDAIQHIVPNSVHQMEQLFNLSHSTQVLFAENVVLTEGKTELRLLPFLFKKVTSKTMGQGKHALVAQSGVNDTKKSLEILSAMDLPAKAICDLDYGLTGAIRDGGVFQDSCRAKLF